MQIIPLVRSLQDLPVRVICLASGITGLKLENKQQLKNFTRIYMYVQIQRNQRIQNYPANASPVERTQRYPAILHPGGSKDTHFHIKKNTVQKNIPVRRKFLC